MQVNKDINSNKNISKMQDDIQIFINEIFSEFMQINIEINQSGAFKPVNFKEVAEEMTKELNRCKELLKFLEEGFNKNTLKSKGYIYIIYKETLENFITLLELDIKMDYKLYDKSQGGKYGYFEYRRESKIRNKQAHKVMELVQHLANNFAIKTFPRETTLMIDNCKRLFIDFKGMYDKCLEQETGYTKLKNELCEFYDKFLIMPFSPDNKQFRDGVLFTITDFIELLEYRENNSDNVKITELENKLFANLEIISDQIYEIIV